MTWVMGRTLPEDVPIESKTVAKAIERAQNTVEARNAEMRKDDLKYDEVMDQQRKVIYERRLQIIDGDDLEEHTEDLLAGAAEKLVGRALPDRVRGGLGPQGPRRRADAVLPDQVHRGGPGAGGDDRGPGRVDRRGGARLLRDSTREAMPGGAETMRQIERDVYLQIMDARWRDHLAEMDNLKDGIHLRWTVQADPLNAWQQEGYSMFGQLMEVIDNDYLRYILHVEAVQQPAAEPDLDRAVYAAAEDPVAETGALAAALLAEQGANVPAQTPRCCPRAPSGAGVDGGAGRERRTAAGKAQDQAAQRARPRRPGAHRQGAAREGRPQRPVLVRERQEVQVLPWRRLTGPRPSYPATSHPSSRRSGSGWPRPSATSGATSSRPGGPSSRRRWPRPDLWDDADNARAVTKELGRVSADLEQLDDAAQRARRRPGAARADRGVGRRGRRRRRARRRAGRDRRRARARGSARWSCSRSSRASTTSSTRCAKCTPARAGPTRRTGPR